MGRRADASRRREWQDRLFRYRRSGLSVARFCENEGVSASAFYYWKRRLTSQTPPGPRFVPVSVVGERLYVEVELPSRTIVRLPEGLAPKMLEAVLAAASRVSEQETRPC